MRRPSPADAPATTADQLGLKAKPGELTVAEALADPTSPLSRRARQFATDLEAAKRRSRSQLRSLSPDQRHRVGRMPCNLGDAYLARLSGHRRSPRARPVRRRGSRRSSASGRSQGRGEPPDDDDPAQGRYPHELTAGAAS